MTTPREKLRVLQSSAKERAKGILRLLETLPPPPNEYDDDFFDDEQPTRKLPHVG